jgi:hypothetical protein
VLKNKSFRIVAEVEIPKGGAGGVLATRQYNDVPQPGKQIAQAAIGAHHCQVQQVRPQQRALMSLSVLKARADLRVRQLMDLAPQTSAGIIT